MPCCVYRVRSGLFHSGYRRLPSMTRNRSHIALMWLVEHPSDDQPSHKDLFAPRMNLQYYPFEQFHFDDALYNKSTAPQFPNLVGAKVLRIANANADEAIQ